MSQRTETRNGAKAFSQMNSSMVVKIGIVATVTVGGMDAAVEPSGMSLWRVTGETMTIHPTPDDKLILF